MSNRFMKWTILLIIALAVCGCANHREARRKSVQLYPGLAQREVVNLFGMPSKAEGNRMRGVRLVTTLRLGGVWQHIPFRTSDGGRTGVGI